MAKLKIRSRGTDTERTSSTEENQSNGPKTMDVKENRTPWAAPPMTKDYERLRAKVAIDKNDLDTCVEEQTQLYQEVAEKVSMFMSQRDALNEEVLRLDATLADSIRNYAIAHKEPKTVGAVNDEVLKHALHIGRQQEYASKKTEADVWQRLLSTYEQRAKMLQVETSLYTSGYFMTSIGNNTSAKNRDAGAEQARTILAERRAARNKGQGS